MTPQEKTIRQDLRELVVNQPFFASIILKQKLVITDSHPTAAVNGVELKVNPSWFCELDPYERMTVLAHEALHLTNKHNLRRGSRDHKIWNIACDMAINKHLKRSPFKLPEKGTFDVDNKYGDGADAEYIYACLLKEIAEELDKKKDDDDQGDDDNNDQDQEESSSDANQDEESDARSKAIDAVSQKYSPNGGMGEVEDHPMVTESPQELMNAQDIATNQAMQQAKKRGKMPNSIEEEINRSYEKKVSWRDILSRWIEGISQADYNWLYPHDVHLQSDLIMPSMHNDGYGEIMIAIDTSASMCVDQLRLAVTEVYNALECYQQNEQSDIKLGVMYFDCEVHKTEYISSPSEISKPVGRGGTDYTPVFDYVSQSPNPPRGLIVITDGYCYVYKEDMPNMDVIWMLTDMSAKRFNPPFGECIQARLDD